MPEDISSSQADTESVVRAAVCPPLLLSLKIKFLERGEESLVGGPEGPIEVGGVCEPEVGTEADMEDGEVDVAGGIDEVWISGYKSEGFTLSETVRRKRLAKKNVFKGVVDTAHFPQFEFSNLQHLPLTFLLEFVCWPVIKFYQASCAARADT